MKKSIIIPLFTTSLISAETTYLNQIKQINSFKNDEGVINTTQQLISNLGESGRRQAAEGIMGTSTFKLITINGDTGVLDKVTVSSYLADAEVTIQGPSADPYNSNPNNEPNHVPRTQAGQGFTIHYKVTDLLPKAEGTPEAASSVLYQEQTYTYGEDATSAEAGVAPTQTTQQDIDSNGSVSVEGSALG